MVSHAVLNLDVLTRLTRSCSRRYAVDNIAGLKHSCLSNNQRASRAASYNGHAAELPQKEIFQHFRIVNLDICELRTLGLHQVPVGPLVESKRISISNSTGQNFT